MAKGAMFKSGLYGTVVTAICCFTPVLPWALGLIGLTLLIPYLDYILFPILAIFLAMMVVSWRRSQGARPSGGTACKSCER
jgi:mercuric ion transport protein